MKTTLVLLAAVLLQANARATLVHEYKFDGNLADSAGSWNATGVNSPQILSGSAPQGSGYLALSGSNYVTIPSTGLSAQFSIAAWFRNSGGVTGPLTIIANGASGGDAAGFKLFANHWAPTANNNGALLLESGAEYSGGAVTSTSDGLVSDTQWHHVGFTANATEGTASIYCDGKWIADGEFNSWAPLSGDLLIGIMTNGAYPLIGQLDDLCIYDTVLTTAEAQAATAPLLSAIPEVTSSFTLLGLISSGMMLRRRAKALL